MTIKKRAAKAGSTKSTRGARMVPKEEPSEGGKLLAGVTVPGVDLQRGVEGAAVKQLQSALVKAGVMTQAQMNTGPGVFGPKTQASLEKFQKAHELEVDGIYGPKTRAAFVRLGAKVAKSAKPPALTDLRKKIVAEGNWGVANKEKIHYSQRRPIDGIKKAHKLPLNIDCSGFVTLCYKWAGAPDPNGNGYNGWGNTGTLERHMRHIPKSRIQPGDLCLWKGKHVSLVLKAGADPLLITHGSEKGPYTARLSNQKKYIGGTLIWLTLPTANEGVSEGATTPCSAEDGAKGEPPAEEGVPDGYIVPLPAELQREMVPKEPSGGGKLLAGVTVPRVDLQRGAEGAAVKQLQSALVKAGVMTQAQMNTGPGVFGPKTQASLEKFQKAHGLEADGSYGPKTRAAFVRLGAKVAKSAKPPAGGHGGHKNPFLPQFQRALAHLRLPKAWASSEAVWQIIQHESSWNPSAKNPSSTAFGLFQFLKSTWKTYIHEAPYGSGDPYIQALGGFRYVKARYGTPQRAWAFWQKHHWW